MASRSPESSHLSPDNEGSEGGVNRSKAVDKLKILNRSIDEVEEGDVVGETEREGGTIEAKLASDLGRLKEGLLVGLKSGVGPPGGGGRGPNLT